MAYWRMKLRAESDGENIWEQCRRERVVAIEYEPIRFVDLGPFSREKHPEEWDELANVQKGNMAKFAWDIRGGNTIYVAINRPISKLGGQVVAFVGTSYSFLANDHRLKRPTRDWKVHPR
jgi:hypothetical protein